MGTCTVPPKNTIGVDASVALLPDLRKNVPARLKYSGVEQWPAREPHKLEVVGSNPTPAPKLNNMSVETEALMVLGIFAGFLMALIIILDQENK